MMKKWAWVIGGLCLLLLAGCAAPNVPANSQPTDSTGTTDSSLSDTRPGTDSNTASAADSSTPDSKETSSTTAESAKPDTSSSLAASTDSFVESEPPVEQDDPPLQLYDSIEDVPYYDLSIEPVGERPDVSLCIDGKEIGGAGPGGRCFDINAPVIADKHEIFLRVVWPEKDTQPADWLNWWVRFPLIESEMHNVPIDIDTPPNEYDFYEFTHGWDITSVENNVLWFDIGCGFDAKQRCWVFENGEYGGQEATIITKDGQTIELRIYS